MNPHPRGTRAWAVEEDRQIREMLGGGQLQKIQKAILQRDAEEEKAKNAARGGAPTPSPTSGEPMHPNPQKKEHMMPQHTPARPWVTPLIEDALHGATLQDLDHDYARLLEAGSSQEQAAGYVRMQATNEALIAVATDGKDFPIPEWAVDTGDWSILTATSDVVRTHTAYEAKAGDLYACITVEEYAENVDGGTRFAMPEVEVFEGKAFYDLEVLHFAQDLDELARRYEQLVEALGEQR